MKSYSSRELIKMVEDDGWFLIDCTGSHHQFKHKTKKGKVTIPHPRKNLPMKTVKTILKQAGLGE
ncbi:MAG: type II toxin-antitoxin system HicA family toxin [Bacillota bacterium]|nr:type II toxin-antitoxin system HicA family toxin [Bacillota bacterium]